MTAITEKANLEYRDMESPGSSVPNDPDKVGIRELFAVIDIALSSLGVNGAITVKKATLALLDADLAHAADTLAVVYNDSTAANNGIYAKVGGSGSGSWELTDLALPASFSSDLAEVLARIEEVDAAVIEAEDARDQALQALADIESIAQDAPDAPSVVVKLNKVATRADLADQPTGVAYVWVAEVEATYRWDAASVLTADGWGIISATGGGTGRWIAISSSLSFFPASGGGSETSRLTALMRSASTLGFTAWMRDGTFTFATSPTIPRTGCVLKMSPGTRIVSTLPTSPETPANAIFYSTPGAADITTTVAAANTINTNSVRSTVNIPAGYDCRIIDNDPANRFRGSTYRVLSSTLNSGSYVLVLDRPVLTQFSTGDEIVAWAAGIPRNFILQGNGAWISGTGTRFMELICTAGYDVRDLNFQPGAGIKSICSMDSCGHDNHYSGLFADNKFVVSGTLQTGVCENGGLLETQEGSSISGSIFRNMLNDGVRLLNCESPRVDVEATGCAYGIVIGGEGGDHMGTNNARIRGRYNGNTTQGIAIIEGSRNTDIDAEARFNPINLQIGDSSGGTVTGTMVSGLFDYGSAISISVASATAGTVFRDIDTSNSIVGISTGTADHYFAGTWEHTGATTTNVLLLAGGRAWVDAVNFNLTGSAASFVRATGAGRMFVARGYVTGPTGSNLFQAADTSKITIGGGVVAVVAGGQGVNVESGATVEFLAGSDFTGCALESGGTGTALVATRRLNRQGGNVGTTAVTTEETLRNYAMPGGTLKPGQKVIIRGAGTMANNANTKALRVRIGAGGSGSGTAAFAVALTISVAGQWSFEVVIESISSNVQKVSSRVLNQAAETTSVIGLTETDGNTLNLALTGQNGTANANDLVVNVFEVIQTSS